MSDMHTPLRECPFCGGEAEFSQTGRYELTLKCVGVQPSGLRGCGPVYRQRVLPNRHTLDWLQGVMAETWNRRSSQDAETIKALEEQVAYWKGASDRMSARNHELNDQVAKFGDRLSLRDTFITEKGLWHEFATTVLPSASLSASQKEQA